jgi:NADH:ubiquinone oxidoreductase subunit 4 (subunit M)
MYQRIAFGGSYSPMFFENIEDVNKREFMLLSTLVVPTVMLGIYTAPILDCLNYGASTLIFSSDFTVMCDATQA